MEKKLLTIITESNEFSTFKDILKQIWSSHGSVVKELTTYQDKSTKTYCHC